MSKIIFFNEKDRSSIGITPDNIEESIDYINKNKISTIFINGDFNFDNFDFFNDIKIESIALNNNKIDTSKFPILSNVKNIFLNTFEGILDISRFPNLYQLTMDWNNKIKFITGNNGVERLIVWKYNPKSKTLKELCWLNNIKYMQINNANIETLEYIDFFDKITHLELNYVIKLLSLKYIISLKKTLKILYLDHAKKIDDFNTLSILENLELLVISDCGKIDNIKFVKEMANMKNIRIISTDIIDGDLSSLLELENVRIYPFKKSYSHKQEDFNNVLD